MSTAHLQLYRAHLRDVLAARLGAALRLGAVVGELRPPPHERARAERHAREGERGQHEARVAAQRAQVLPEGGRTQAVALARAAG